MQATQQAVGQALHDAMDGGIAASTLRNFLQQCARPKEEGRLRKKHTMTGQSLEE
jgi:hypothetical protein